jgi:hypothetical protein
MNHVPNPTMGISLLSIPIPFSIHTLHPPSLLYPYTYSSPHSKHRTTNNENPLLLPAHPLYNLIRALRQRRSARMSRRYSIQFKQRRTPRERNRRSICFVVHFESRGFVVHVGVEFIVKVEQSVVCDQFK